jgi:hypothetical protein
VRSGEEGAFSFAATAAGPYTLASAGAPGFLPYAPEWGQSPVRLMARPGRRVEGLTVFLFPAVDYQGLVLDPDGKPVAGAVVRLLGTPRGEQVLDALPARYQTDRAGTFVFHAPDEAVFEARKRGFAPGRGVLDGKVAVSHRMRIVLGRAGSAPAGNGRIGGRVLDEGGEPLPGAVITVWAAEGQ